MQQPRAVLWDWDNTLVDGWASVSAALNVAFAAFDLPPWTVEQTRNRVRGSMRDSFPAVFGPEWRRAALLFRTTMEERHLDDLRPMRGAAEALDAGAFAPQAVVSNKDGPLVRREVEHLGWNLHFRSVVGAGDAAADKPHAEPIRHALVPIGVNPGPDVWYVGDTALDIQTAREAGCTAILLGEAEHEGGVAALQGRGVFPDLHFVDAHALAARLRVVAAG